MIEVDGLSKRFGKTQAVAGLSFRVEPGTITGFLGPNGAGKSTTLRSVLGLVHPDAGSATVLGVPYRQLDRPLHRVGAVLEASEVHPGRSGRNHLRVQAAAAGLPASRVEEVLALVELTAAAKRRVKGYSLGMRQRLGLATALLGDPEVLVLDEPANGLDPAGIRWLRDLLRSLAAEGRTILVSSHVLSEVAQTADRVVIIHRGRLIQQAAMADVLAGASGSTRVRTPDAERLRALLAAQDVAVSEAEDGALLASVPPERIGELAAANGIVLHELSVEQATLEEVFLELTGGETTAVSAARALRAAQDPDDARLVGVPGGARRCSSGSRVGGGDRLARWTSAASWTSRSRSSSLVGLRRVLAIILGITMVTTEFRHGTITPTLLADAGPRAGARARRRSRACSSSLLFAVLASCVVIAAVALAVAVDHGDEIAARRRRGRRRVPRRRCSAPCSGC